MVLKLFEYNQSFIIYYPPAVKIMATALSLELDPIFLKGLGFLHSKSKDSAEKLRALLDESMSRGSDSSYRSSIKVSCVTHVIYFLVDVIQCYKR